MDPEQKDSLRNIASKAYIYIHNFLGGKFHIWVAATMFLNSEFRFNEFSLIYFY